MPPQDPSSNFENFSEQQLKAANWYVSHKILLKKILIGFLIVFCAGFLGYGVYGLINYYFIEGPEFTRMTREWVGQSDLEAIRAKFRPENLEAGGVTIISAGKEKYDLVAGLYNPNPSWRAEFDYTFVIDGQELSPQSGFILPGEEKFLLNLNAESKAKPRRAELEISNLMWQRVDAHEIPDYATWRDLRLNFVFEDVKFSPAVVRDSITVSRASFNVKNSTAFSFWDVGFHILLYRGNSLAGANFIRLEEFVSGQTRPVEVSWFEPLSSVTQVKVFPEVDIFDRSVYMPVD